MRITDMDRGTIGAANKEFLEEFIGKGGNIIGGSNLEKTVASESSATPEDFDFVNLVEAFKWINASRLNLFRVRLNLDDGIHYTINNEYNDEFISNFAYLYLDSISGNSDNCFLTIPANFTAISYPRMLMLNVPLDISDITVDPTVAGYLTAGHYVGLIRTSKVATLYRVKIKKLHFLITHQENNSKSIYCYGCEFSDFDYSILVYVYGQEIYFRDCTFTNIPEIIYYMYNATAYVRDCTFIDVPKFTADFEGYANTETTFRNCVYTNSFELPTAGRRSQYNGIVNVITDTFNGVWAGETTNRPPLTLPNDRSYMDTDINKPIWFNGTDWIDSTGTTV